MRIFRKKKPKIVFNMLQKSAVLASKEMEQAVAHAVAQNYRGNLSDEKMDLVRLIVMSAKYNVRGTELMPPEAVKAATEWFVDHLNRAGASP